MARYVSNDNFLELIKEYKRTKNKKTYNIIGDIFISIATNLLNKTNFIEYTQDRKDEMISDATYYMVRYIDRFDIEKDNPFSYFTTIAFRAFLRYINIKKKNDDIFKSLEYIDNINIEQEENII